jgi:hypothetical protein
MLFVRLNFFVDKPSTRTGAPAPTEDSKPPSDGLLELEGKLRGTLPAWNGG